jgi:phospholipid transport system transporter-binding protein
MLLLPEKVDVSVARDTLRMLSQALKREADPNITVDASSLAHFDSSALAVLLECQRLAHAWGKGFGVRRAPPKLTQLARLYGIDDLLLPPEAPVEAAAAA